MIKITVQFDDPKIITIFKKTDKSTLKEITKAFKRRKVHTIGKTFGDTTIDFSKVSRVFFEELED